MTKRRILISLAVILTAASFAVVYAAAAGAKSDFARTTIDIGIVVSNVEKTAQFYKNALGFTEIPGFDITADKGRDTGLTDSRAFSVRVLVPANEPNATRIKLIEFPDAPGRKIDNRFIHSSLGVRYLTILVSDTNAAVERAKKAGVTPIKEPYQLSPSGSYLTLLRDPDGNIIELVGPKKN